MPQVFDAYSEYLSFYVNDRNATREQRQGLARLFDDYHSRTSVLLKIIENLAESKVTINTLTEKCEALEKELSLVKAALEARESLYVAAQLVIETTDELKH